MDPYLFNNNSKIRTEWINEFITIEIPIEIKYNELFELIENAYNKGYTAVWKKAFDFLIIKMKISNAYCDIYKIIINNNYNCTKFIKLKNKIINKSLYKIKYTQSFKFNDLKYIINHIINSDENVNISSNVLKYIIESNYKDYNIKELFNKLNLNFDLFEVGVVLKNVYPEFYNIRFGIIERILLLIKNETSRWSNDSENYFDHIKLHVAYNKQLDVNDNIIDKFNERIDNLKNNNKNFNDKKFYDNLVNNDNIIIEENLIDNKIELQHLSNLINKELDLTSKFNFNIYSYVDDYKKIVVHIYSYSDEYVNFESNTNNWYDINKWILNMITNDNFNNFAKEKENTLFDFKKYLTITSSGETNLYTLFDSTFKIEI
jgi:hypothetical protein